MSLPLLSLKVAAEQDLVAVRQRTRQLTTSLGFEAQDQTRIATAVSEICRNAYSYAGGGKVEYLLEQSPAPQSLTIRVSDRGPGIANVRDVLEGRFTSTTGMGVGIAGARRLMDTFDVETAAGGGTTVILQKRLPARARRIGPRDVDRIASELAAAGSDGTLSELRQQNLELLRTLDELRAKQEELRALNRELEDTNRGVVALYAELDEKAEHLRQVNQIKSTFLSHMSHEFRTPLNSIMSLAQILLARLDGDLTAEQDKQVNFILKAAQELTDMVNDLLDLAKVEAGKVDVHPTEWRVSNLFGTLRGMLRPLLFGQAVQLSFEYQEDFALVTDEAKLSQILRNFISNAIKFTEQGEIRVIAASAEAGAVRFSVSDSGIGIAPQDQERIFEQFAQIDSQRQRSVKGTGLGLPLTRKLAELLGGRVELQSRVGAGSTFSVVLPKIHPSVAEADSREPLLVATASRATFTPSVADFEKLTGLRVRFIDPPAIEQAIRDLSPAAVLVDVRTSAGWAAVATAANAFPDIPLLVAGRSADEPRARAATADAFVSEPFSADALVGCLRAARQHHSGPLVLLIDDGEMARYVASKQLAGFARIVEARNADEGLRMAREAVPAVIVLDLSMPELDGFKALDQLAAEPVTAGIPVVVHTSMHLSAAQLDRIRAHAKAIVDKKHAPPGVLLAAVERVLAGVHEGAPTAIE